MVSFYQKYNKLKRFIEILYVYWTKLEDLRSTKIKNAIKAWHDEKSSWLKTLIVYCENL